MAVLVVTVVSLSPGLSMQEAPTLQRQSTTGLACLLPELCALVPMIRKPGGSADARAEEGEQRQFFRPPAMR